MLRKDRRDGCEKQGGGKERAEGLGICIPLMPQILHPLCGSMQDKAIGLLDRVRKHTSRDTAPTDLKIGMRQSLKLCRMALWRKRNDDSFLWKQIFDRQHRRRKVTVGRYLYD